MDAALQAAEGVNDVAARAVDIGSSAMLVPVQPGDEQVRIGHAGLLQQAVQSGLCARLAGQAAATMSRQQMPTQPPGPAPIARAVRLQAAGLRAQVAAVLDECLAAPQSLAASLAARYAELLGAEWSPEGVAATWAARQPSLEESDAEVKRLKQVSEGSLGVCYGSLPC